MNILDRIVADKKIEVAAALRERPLADLRAQIAETPWQARGFTARLAQTGADGVNIIAEIKRASPSKGAICPELDAAQCARQYEEGGAAAVSVLTDGQYFKGALADLVTVRAAVQLPVLRKEFIIGPYQVYETRAAGADALLLIVRILAPPLLAALLELTHNLGMEALVEVHDDAELAVARAAGARLIGVNNRNLADFSTSITTAVAMARRFRPDEVPVAASGIDGRDAIAANLQAGIHNFLIGESLVRAADRVAFLRSLRSVT